MVKILIIKYNKTELDIIFENGDFGYFHGENRYLEFNQYSMQVDIQHESYDALIDYLSSGKKCISDFKGYSSITDFLILEAIHTIIHASTLIDVYLIQGEIQSETVISSINEFIFSKKIPLIAKKTILCSDNIFSILKEVKGTKELKPYCINQTGKSLEIQVYLDNQFLEFSLHSNKKLLLRDSDTHLFFKVLDLLAIKRKDNSLIIFFYSKFHIVYSLKITFSSFATDSKIFLTKYHEFTNILEIFNDCRKAGFEDLCDIKIKTPSKLRYFYNFFKDLIELYMKEEMICPYCLSTYVKRIDLFSRSFDKEGNAGDDYFSSESDFYCSECNGYFDTFDKKYNWKKYPPKPSKEKAPSQILFVKEINEYITLKAEGDYINIYVKGEVFKQCMFLVLDIKNNSKKQHLIDSIDEAEELFKSDIPPDSLEKISIEEQFKGHASNLQAWVEHGYNTKVLHMNLAFPLLKKLSQVGDPLAKRVFKEEIATRIESNYRNVDERNIKKTCKKFLNLKPIEIFNF